MPSQTKENYLKAIFFLDRKEQDVTLTALGQEMEVSTPTANSMIKKLDAMGWVKYQKYKPITLTEAGRLEAALIVRKHRLTEMFLTKIMGFGWEEVHDIAEEMEHLNNEAFFERMDELLGRPKYDPHGSPIPNKEGQIEQRDLTKLSEMQVGDCVVLKQIGDDDSNLLKMLDEKSLALDSKIVIRRIQPYDQMITLQLDEDEEVIISKRVADQLLVL